jgi:AraC-type DNA-binding domain-containing proteins
MAHESEFLARIDDLFARGEISRVEKLVDSGSSRMPADASLMEEARAIVCLDGQAAFRGERGEIRLKAGEGLFVSGRCWVRAQPRQPYASMGVVFYANATRFYLMRGEAGRANAGRPVETCVVPAGLPEDERALVRLLARAEGAAADARFDRNAFECLLLAARALLAAPPAEPPGKAHFMWQAACHYLADNLHRPIGRKEVARELRVHPNHLSRLFAEFGRESFSEHLQTLRLERARLLLSDPRLNVAEVARLCGFGSANYFTRVCRRAWGRTPTRARRAGAGPTL